jgi:hypothetical protein
MEILKDVFAELFSMFVTDARLTFVTLLLVVAVAVLVAVLHVSPLIAGLVLLFGCCAIIIEATFREMKLRAKR